MNYTNILLDLDGTLTDPKLGITNSVRYALSHFGIEEPDTAKLETFIGPPLLHSFMTFYSFTEADAWRAVAIYREYFKRSGMFENEVYAGIPELLQLLQSQGRLLYVATSKPRVFAEQILVHFKLDTYFEKIYGSELDGVRTDKTELIAYIIAESCLAKDRTVMIGDREYDIMGASNNDIDSIAVGFGYGSRHELIAAKPTYHFQTLGELTEAFYEVT